jgi:hypothetical protein
MSQSPSFYFSLTVLTAGILSGLYLFYHWWRHKEHKLALYWAAGLFLQYWFQVPAILANARIHLILSDFNLFYSIAFPLLFLGTILIYCGILSVVPPKNTKKTTVFLAAWVLLSFLIFGYYFILMKGHATNRITLFIPSIFFFLPLYGLILAALWRWNAIQDYAKTKFTVIGLFLIAISFLMKTIGHFMVLYRIWSYPIELWFMALVNFNAIYLMESFSTLLLITAFLLINETYRGTADINESQQK